MLQGETALSNYNDIKNIFIANKIMDEIMLDDIIIVPS